MFSYAYEKPDLQKIYKESQEVTRGLYPKLQELAKGRGDIGKIQDALNTQGTANHQTVDLNNLPSLGEKAKENDAEKAECTKSSCNVTSVMSTKATRKREVKLEEYGFTKNAEQFYQDDKGYIDKARHDARKFAKNYDSISGSYKDCTQKDQSYSYRETSQCDEYYDVKYSNCPISQIVEIDPKYTYMCSKKREEKEKRCEEVLNLSCAEKRGSGAGVVKGSIPNDVQWEHVEGLLKISVNSLRANRNIWSWNRPDHSYMYESPCGEYDRSASFIIQDLSKILEFTLIGVDFRSHLWIKVNGTTAYVGPDGGNKIGFRNAREKIGRRWQNTVNFDQACEKKH